MLLLVDGASVLLLMDWAGCQGVDEAVWRHAARLGARVARLRVCHRCFRLLGCKSRPVCCLGVPRAPKTHLDSMSNHGCTSAQQEPSDSQGSMLEVTQAPSAGLWLTLCWGQGQQAALDVFHAFARPQ